MTKTKHAQPVRLAPENEKLFTIAKCLNRGEKIDAGLLSSVLYRAVIYSYHSLAETFLEAGADATAFADRFTNNGDPQQNEFTAVRCAVLKDDAKMIDIFSRHGVDFHKPVKQTRNTITIATGNAMQTALQNGKTAAAHALLDAGFNILHPSLDLDNKPSNFPLTHALETGNDDIALRMIDRLTDVTCLHKYDILAEAASAGLRGAVMEILKKAAQLGCPFDTNKVTRAAIYAANKGHTDILETLLSMDADPNLFCTFNDSVAGNIQMQETLLHNTIGSYQLDAIKKERIVRLMLQHGADPKIKTHDDMPRDAIEMAQQEFNHLLPLLSQAKHLRDAFFLAKIQPAIDKIYTGGDKPLPLPTRRRPVP